MNWTAIRKHLLDARDIRDHWASNMCGWHFEAPGQPIGLREKLITLRDTMRTRWAATVCEVRGHNIEADAANPESGSEDLSCTRCGWSQRVYHN
jgi:hypothetical protein